jgi:HSP20 family molecular chaperone IbpA
MLIKHYDIFEQEVINFFNTQYELNTEVLKEDNLYKLITEVPGIKKENIQVIVEKDELSITVSTQEEAVKKFQILPEIDTTKISCSLDLGILEIVLPLKEDAIPKKRSIEIK